MEHKIACAVMLVNGRLDMVKRALDSFRKQNYPEKRIVILDTTPIMKKERQLWDWGIEQMKNSAQIAYRWHDFSGESIGRLRNLANHAAMRVFDPEYLLHWDSDDWSSPDRMRLQIEEIEKAAKDGRNPHVVGYNAMLFWDEERQEAWKYWSPNSAIALGTSLCYRVNTWKLTKFLDLHDGEDTAFCSELRTRATSSLIDDSVNTDVPRPLMIARIHSGNTSGAYRYELRVANEKQGDVWSRVPQYDALCRDTMEGELEA